MCLVEGRTLSLSRQHHPDRIWPMPRTAAISVCGSSRAAQRHPPSINRPQTVPSNQVWGISVDLKPGPCGKSPRGARRNLVVEDGHEDAEQSVGQGDEAGEGNGGCSQAEIEAAVSR